jgi:transposase-like protein
MFPFEVLNSEVSAANLLEQVRWRDGLYYPGYRSESVIKHGSYGECQRYLCKDCDRTFNPKTSTIFAQGRSASTSSCSRFTRSFGSTRVFTS